MGQEIATRDDGFAVSERSGTNLIKGIITKFADSIYKANKTEVIEQAPQGPVFVVTGVVTAWVHWKAGRPIEHKITQTGQVKVLDFGLAKAIEDHAGAAGDPASSPTVTVRLAPPEGTSIDWWNGLRWDVQ